MELQWPLIIFTTFLCLSSGTLGATALFSLRKDFWHIQVPGLIVSFVSLLVGGIASVTHLKTPARYFGQLGNINSGINQEIIMMGLVAVVIVIYFISLRRLGNASPVIKVLSAVLALALPVVVGHSYIMPAIPAWNTALLPLYYVLHAALLGVFAVLLLGAFVKEGAQSNARPNMQPNRQPNARPNARLLGVVTLVVAVALCLGVTAYSVYLSSLSTGHFSEVLHVDTTTVPPLDPAEFGQRLLTGSHAVLFWGGVVASGLVLPLVAALVAAIVSGSNSTSRSVVRVSASLGILFSLAGGIAFRAVLYLAASSVFVY